MLHNKVFNFSCTLYILFSLLFSLLFNVRKGIAAAPSNYSDPPGYPSAWPANGDWKSYTLKGSDQYDITRNPDPSRSAAVTQDPDFSSGPSNSDPSIYFYANGSNFYFRIRVDGPPLSLSGSGEPFNSRTWNFLLDSDGDGFREYIIELDGEDKNNEPDDIITLYNSGNQHPFLIGGSNIWRQDSAMHTDPVKQTDTDGEPDGSGSWDKDPDPYIWDFGRTRVIQIEKTESPGSNSSEYYIDIQVPIEALDATSLGGPIVDTYTAFSITATTSDSNTDPMHKDILYNGCYLNPGDTDPAPGGDIIDVYGNIYQPPLVISIKAVNCPLATLTTNILDAKIDSGSCTGIIDTITAVSFEYYLDLNGDGFENDSGSTWTLIGYGVSTGTLGEYRYADWDTNDLAEGQYIMRAIVTDDQSNIIYSDSQPPFQRQVDYYNLPCGASTTYGIFGTVFVDNNEDSVDDTNPEDPGIAGVALTLYLDDGDYQFEPVTEDIIFTCQANPVYSGASGFYSFSGLGDNNYYWVDVDENDSNIPRGSILTTKFDPIGVNISGTNATGRDFGFSPMPDILVMKSSLTISDPFHGAANPKAIPNAQVLYTIHITNKGAGAVDSDSIMITDPVPVNTVLYVNDIGGPGSGPVAFIDCDVSSGLNYTFTSLGSTSDDVDFSNDGGSSYTYTPVPDVNGYDSNVDYLRINPKGFFKGASGGSYPCFELLFKVRVN